MKSLKGSKSQMLKASQDAKAISEGVKPIMRRAIAERDEWRPSRTELHALVDACCDLAEVSRACGSMGTIRRGYDPPARAARDIARALSIGAFGWTEPPAPVALRYSEGAEAIEAWRRGPAKNLSLWRMEVAERLRRAPSVLPATMVQQLAGALESLNDSTGETPALLAPLPKEGRGQNPRAARRLEEQLWHWIYYQHGAGRRLSDAIADVAAAVNRSDGAVKAWRDAWRSRDAETFSFVPMEASVQDWMKAGKEDAANNESLRYEAAEMRELAKAWLDATTPAKAVPES